MVARRPEEAERTSTPLELLFDLCFVVAVSQAAAVLHHALVEGHPGSGVLNYLLVFFAIWWAWMNFTWFASAYDTDDALYRVTTLVQIAGGLVLAAGVTPAAQTHDFTVITVGYVIMRLAMVAQWLRAARGDPPRRRAALFFAGGITVVQVGWICRLGLPQSLFLPGFAVLATCELLVPVFGERLAATTWHPRHIAERYGCFTLIVLGESVLSATMAVQTGLASQEHVRGLASLAIAGLVIVFSMWWLYFEQPAHQHLTSLRNSIIWGYGHLFIFAAAAAVGAGLGVAVDYETGQSSLTRVSAAMATTLPVAVYLSGVWLLNGSRRTNKGFPTLAVLVLLASFSPAPVVVTALLMALLVGLSVQRPMLRPG
jgi:low temperature requirement protein LtrA